MFQTAQKDQIQPSDLLLYSHPSIQANPYNYGNYWIKFYPEVISSMSPDYPLSLLDSYISMELLINCS